MGAMKPQNLGRYQPRDQSGRRTRFILNLSASDRERLDAMKRNTGWSGAKVVSMLLRQTNPDDGPKTPAAASGTGADALAEALGGMRAELRRIGVNVNQVAYIANRDSRVTDAGLRLVADMVREIHELVQAAGLLYHERLDEAETGA